MALPRYFTHNKAPKRSSTGTSGPLSDLKDDRTPKWHIGPTRRQYQNDYTGLASLMVDNPEKAIVRRFALLNMKNLLYMQAELAVLEEDLAAAVEYDKQFEDTKEYAQSWFWLENGVPATQAFPPEGGDVPEAGGSNPSSPVNTARVGWSKARANEPPTQSRQQKAALSSLYRPESIGDQIPSQVYQEYYGPRQSITSSIRPMLTRNDKPLVQRDLVHEIRRKLEKYNKALEQVGFSFGLSSPKKMDVKSLRDWLQRQEGGKQFLVDVEGETWQPKHERDLVGLAIPPGENDDAFSTAISKRLIAGFIYANGVLRFISEKFLHRRQQPDAEPVVQWSDSWLLFLVSLVFTTLAACFPVLAILALYKTNADGVSKGWQIGMIGFFSATCAAVLALAKAKRTDVFLATSAFAAVMVVFIKA
ncbi:hypothetical protein LZ554_000197 [Drepanopeziza brunnea f. sp. 'monogermtubi']|nr:hypothetical protein LZ554_000197 [Drepanopeziza brunnea f. sp. 'monogermtubi']